MKSMTPEMFERIQIVFAKTSKYTGVDAKVFPKPDKTFHWQNVQYLGIAKLCSLCWKIALIYSGDLDKKKRSVAVNKFSPILECFVPNRTMCLFDILAHSTKGKYFKSYLKKYICKNSQNTWANGDICLFVDFTRNVLYTFEEVSYINWILLATVLHICLTYNIKVT